MIIYEKIRLVVMKFVIIRAHIYGWENIFIESETF